MELNPIVKRELRSRWRGWGSFVLVFSFASLLAAGFALIYANELTNLHDFQFYYSDEAGLLNVLGRNLFTRLAWSQALGWALLAPALTATSIAGERERGLLEGLQLSSLSPARIVWGKLGSVALFIALVQLVSIPTVATCLLIGGVAPAQLLQALVLLAITAITGAAIGLACSAWSRRSNTALGMAYLIVVLWLGFSGFSMALASTVSTMSGWWSLFSWIGPSNPVWVAYLICGDDYRPVVSALSLSTWWTCIAAQLSICLVCFVLTLFGLRRPQREQYWVRFRRPRGRAAHVTSSDPPGTSGTLVEDDQYGHRSAERWTAPFAGSLRLRNPILRRELHENLSMRAVTAPVVAFLSLLALVSTGMYLCALVIVVVRPQQRQDVWGVILVIGLLISVLVVGVMGAGAFCREREAGTWEALRLSLVSPLEIVVAKAGSILLICLFCTVPAVPLVLLSIRSFTRLNSNDGLSLIQVVTTALLLASAAWAFTLWGMLVSWYCRSTSTAVSWTLGTIFLYLLVVPMALNVESERVSDWINPIAILSDVSAYSYASAGALWPELGCTLFLLGLGSSIFFWLWRAMHRKGSDGVLVPR